MPEINKVNWVKCPNCGFRFYAGAQMFMVPDVMCYCPKCCREFEPEPNLEKKVDSLLWEIPA